MTQRVRSSLPGDSATLFRRRQVVLNLLHRIRRGAVPGAVSPAAGEVLDVLDVGAEIEPSTPQDLPHAIGGGRAIGVLLGVRAGAQRDAGAPDHLAEPASAHRPARDRQVRGSTIPARPADLQVTGAGDGPQQRMAVGVLAGADEAGVADVGGSSVLGRIVCGRVDTLRHEPYFVDTRRSVALHLRQIGDVHAADDSGQRQDGGLGLRIEVPERGSAAVGERPERRLSGQNGVAGQEKEIGLECLHQVPDGPARGGPGIAGPADHVDQLTPMPKVPPCAHEGSFGLVGSAGSQHRDSHAPSITGEGTTDGRG
jgi:hypothetical protein